MPRFPATTIEKKIAETPANAKRSTNKRNFSIQYRTSHQLTVLRARALAAPIRVVAVRQSPALVQAGVQFGKGWGRGHRSIPHLGSILPEPIEAVGAQFGISHRVHDVAVAQEVLKRPGIDAVIGKLEAAGVAEHVRMNGKGKFG